MAEKITIARPYAKAAFEFAREHNSFAAWSELLSTGASVVADERVAKLLSNPKVAPDQLVNLIGEIAGTSLNEQARNFLNTLATNRRLDLLPEISAAYEALRADIENTADVQLISAVPLSDAQREQFANALRKRFKREVRLHCEVDASLIGGAVVRSGDVVIDGSLKAGLERLSRDIAA
jgi:F-type H+-transporting ATPase subunit delta